MLCFRPALLISNFFSLPIIALVSFQAFWTSTSTERHLMWFQSVSFQCLALCRLVLSIDPRFVSAFLVRSGAALLTSHSFRYRKQL